MEGAFETTSGEAVAALTVSQQAGWRQPLPLAVGSLILGSVVTGIAVWNLMPQPDPPTDILRFAMAGPELVDGSGVELAISPDGGRIVYQGPQADGGEGQLYLRSFDQLDGAPLRGTEEARTPFFSPDGEWVGFASEVGGHLQRVSIYGGQPETITRLPLTFAGASWSIDDQIVLGLSNSGLHRVPANGGELEELTTPDEASEYDSHIGPSIIPNAQAVLFEAFRRDDGASQLAVLDLETGEVTQLGLAGTTPRYVATGHVVYATADGSVRAVPFDSEQLTVTGSPVALIEGLTAQGPPEFAVSETGRLVYMTGGGEGGRQPLLVWVDRNGETTPLVEGETYLGRRPRLSPHGNLVALERNGDIWIRDLDRGSDTRLTDEAVNMSPTWVADGTAVTFGSNKTGSFDLYSRRVDLSEPAELLVSNPAIKFPGSWSPDGHTLVFYENNPDSGRSLWVLSDGTASLFFDPESKVISPRLSPDGKWVAYVSDQSGEDRIYVQPFPEGGRVIPISTGPGTEPAWSRDGRELFYRNGTQMMTVAIESGPEPVAGRPRLLFEGDFEEDPLGLGTTNYDVSSTGDRFLMLTNPEAAAPPQMVVVLNWFEELTRLVPTE